MRPWPNQHVRIFRCVQSIPTPSASIADQGRQPGLGMLQCARERQHNAMLFLPSQAKLVQSKYTVQGRPDVVSELLQSQADLLPIRAIR